MLHISLFSGIGGFDLAAEWMGWTNIVSCEINDFGNKVLEHYWPNAYHHRDVKTLTLEKINKELGENWRTDDVILTGGFPCQPYSSAGKRKGKEDERHLWPEMLRVIREIKPSYIVGENVAGLLSWSGGLVFDEVHADLEASGYEVQAVVIPAAAVNAPHERDRVWFVAQSNGSSDGANQFRGLRQKDGEVNGERTQAIHDAFGSDGDERDAADTMRKRYTRAASNGIQEMERTTSQWNDKRTWCSERTYWQRFPTVPPVCSRNDGLSHQLDGITFPKWRKESIKAAGNAVVPQVVYEIFKAIEATRK